MDLHLPCEDPSINDVVPIWNPSAVANSERLRLQGINFKKKYYIFEFFKYFDNCNYNFFIICILIILDDLKNPNNYLI